MFNSIVVFKRDSHIAVEFKDKNMCCVAQEKKLLITDYTVSWAPKINIIYIIYDKNSQY
jgi:hypothetical protein